MQLIDFLVNDNYQKILKVMSFLTPSLDFMCAPNTTENSENQTYNQWTDVIEISFGVR